MRPSWLLGLIALSACTPRTVDTVQPGAIDKDALDGEWYWRRTVTDVPYGTAATFEGASDDLERLRWRIEEDLLLGYRSYPHIDDAGSSGMEEDGYYGAPLLVFRIEKHFDIRRSYDRTTGEESNVIEENMESPWYERDFMRVDWSANLAETGFSMAGLDAKVLGWTTGDDRSEGAPQFDDSNGDGVIDSLLLEQQVLLQPTSFTIPGYGDVPMCLFYGEAEHECNDTEVTVVSSFVRVGDRAPVAGQAYDDRHMETFGFFTTDRMAYDRAYGLVEPNRTRFVNHHPLFAQTFVQDISGDVLCAAEGVTAPCRDLPAELDPEPIEIPLAQREVRPIVYHAGPSFPEDLKPVMAQVAEDWNGPLAETIHGMRYWDCIDNGGKVKDCKETEDPDVVAFVFCPNNPSLPGDPDICSTDHTGPEGRPDGIGDRIRVGDLRYHLVEVFEDAALSSPFGYGPSAADPVGTIVPLEDGGLALGGGEIISGTAFVYGYVLDRVAHQVADLVQLINGELDPDAFVAGENVEAWVDAVKSGDVQSLVGTSSTPAPADALARMQNGFAPSLRNELSQLPRPTDPASFQAFMAQADQVMKQSGTFGAGQAASDLAFEQLMHSEFSQLLLNDEAIGAMGYDPSVTAPTDLAGASPLELVDPARLSELEAGRVLAGQHAVDLDDGAFSDSSLVGLARLYADRGMTYEEIVADVRAQTFREVMLHEVGHTLGLRHNFAGSFDAFNYRSEYWDLRDDGDMGPRHVDPETDAEREGRIREFQYSTVMDYPGSRNVGWAGLGHYDHAAIKFGYGGLVEVLTGLPEQDAVPGLPGDVAMAYISAYNGSNAYPSVVLWYSNGEMLDLHYTQYPAIAGDLEARRDIPMSRLAPTLIEGDGTFTDGLVVADAGGGLDAGLPAVPYRFCSDEFAVGMTCARFDEGADPYEATQFLMERYWNDYLLNNFARDRYGYGDAASYVSRLHSRTFEPLRTWQRYYALFHGIFDAENDPNVAAFFAADRGFGGWTAATDESFRFLVQVITRPEPGVHGELDRADGTHVLSPSYAGTVEVPLVTGAYYESEWDFESGYHWFERQSRIGSYWDRMLALLSLTSTSSYGFLGYDTAIDPRAYAIGYQDLYRDPLALVLGELMSDEVDRLAPALMPDGSVRYPDALDPSAAWPPSGGQLVQPAAYWLVQFNAGMFGKALLSAGYDRSFLNRSRLYVEGSGDAVTPSVDQETVSFTDPYSGKTWTAWSFPADGTDGLRMRDAGGKPIELGSSARMLRKAAELDQRCELDDAACSELQRLSADIDLQFQLYKAFEAATE